MDLLRTQLKEEKGETRPWKMDFSILTSAGTNE